MSESKLYVAVQNFSLNLDNGKSQLDVKIGEMLSFDGLYVECRGERGQARPLAKVVGDWIKQVSTNVPPIAAQPSTIAVSRNATGGLVIEDSDPSRDLGTRAQQEDSNSELKRLLGSYDKAQSVIDTSDKITDDLSDARKECKVQVDNQDDQEVAKVSDNSQNTDSEKNTAGVVLEESTPQKTSTISHEERVAKTTSYPTKDASPEDYVHLKVDNEAAGVEIIKDNAPAINTASTKTAAVQAKALVIEDDTVVTVTHYEEESATIIGSSTQAKVVKDASMSKKATKVAPGAPKRLVVADPADSSEGRVVRKVSKSHDAELTTQDGITSKVTVGSSGDMDLGEVKFESNSEVSDGGVIFSKGEDTVQDIGEDAIDIDGILNLV
jgi:hypothetical protein